ncbi:efflux RND transporter periplasmic adaptor subunit [Pseudoalteromonas sp. SA25]|uniref:HlyD family secretion protein n=1 Tax=Pseudoalteromonas sp. SA25 TaxID=2686347 RepID=UPI0013FD42CF|nr:efflux RND transporter periplasmic adaptor subunit [Pseudoalteromonas sp. SA25]
MKNKAILITAIMGVIAFIGFALLKITEPLPLVFQGQVEAREIDVAAKVTGRIHQVLVREGDNVLTGDALFELESPEIAAKMAQATASRDAAFAMSNKADNGTREEEVRMAESAWARANSAAELAQKTFERFDSLYKEGLISEQQHDEAQTKQKVAHDAEKAAKAQYDMTLNGTRVEDKAAAKAVVAQAKGAIDEVSAYSAETHLTAPISGEIVQVLVDPGELAPAGFPVITIVDLSDSWVVLNVREDHLVNFKIGAKLMAKVPALGDQKIALSVYYIAPQADFATWRATRYSSGYDVKTFEIRMRPNEQIDGLRPGMSVLLSID